MSENKKADGGGPDAKLVLSLVSVVITGLVMAWISSTQDTTTDVTTLKPQIEQLQADIQRIDRVNERQDVWQAEWPRTGQLSGDVRQDARLDFLNDQIEDLENDVRELQERVRGLERAVGG